MDLINAGWDFSPRTAPELLYHRTQKSCKRLWHPNFRPPSVFAGYLVSPRVSHWSLRRFADSRSAGWHGPGVLIAVLTCMTPDFICGRHGMDRYKTVKRRAGNVVDHALG